eukprot:Rhum_TRINITY_DN14551_c9_g1::Rhum_TRINITY_DN14551_c9_g1_i1::g.95883::m.95883
MAGGPPPAFLPLPPNPPTHNHRRNGKLAECLPPRATGHLAIPALALALALTLAVAAAPRRQTVQVVELAGDLLLCVLKEADEGTGVLRVVLTQEGVGVALVARTPRAADAVYVVLHRAREVEVDDARQVADVQAARRHVRRHQHALLRLAEALQRGLTLALALVAVDGHAAEALAREVPRQVVGHALRRREDQHLAASALLQLFQELEGAVGLDHVALRHDEVLRDIRVRLQVAATDLNLHPVLLEVLCQALHLLRPRRTPHERLAARADLPDDLPDLRLESHVEHAVCLVHHQERNPLQVCVVPLKEVDEAPRRRDHHLRPHAQLPLLRSLRRAAVAAHARHRPRHHLHHLLLDLHRQLPRRRQHQRDGPVSAPQTRLRLDVDQRRHAERKRLPRPGLRDAHQVPPRQRRGPPLRLDHRRPLEPLPLERVDDRARKVRLLEGQHGVGHRAPGDGDLVLRAPLPHFLLAALLHRLRHVVEVLLHLHEVALVAVVDVAQRRPEAAHAVAASAEPKRVAASAEPAGVAVAVAATAAAAVAGRGGAAGVVAVAGSVAAGRRGSCGRWRRTAAGGERRRCSAAAAAAAAAAAVVVVASVA